MTTRSHSLRLPDLTGIHTCVDDGEILDSASVLRLDLREAGALHDTAGFSIVSSDMSDDDVDTDFGASHSPDKNCTA